MHDDLWQKTLHFDLDQPPGEYTFSLRLAKENYWTKNFTDLAILEYKKFMFLAGNSDLMVSPSEIVDIVWHQHLIFTRSYTEFCKLLGKQIQHIPSTHNKADFAKFEVAKERTTKLYVEIFGKQPNTIWEYSSMHESLHLTKAKYSLRSFLNFAIPGFIILITPVYFLLKSVFVKIGNPDFIIGFITLCIITFVGLEIYNRKKLRDILKAFDYNSFIFDLHPYEVVFLQKQKISNVIIGSLNELIENESIEINADESMQLLKVDRAKDIEGYQIINLLKELQRPTLPNLVRRLRRKVIFHNFSNSAEALQKHFMKSEKFNALFYINFTISALLLMLILVRLIGGFLNNKPIVQLYLVFSLLSYIIIVRFKKLTKLFTSVTIPDFYKKNILPAKNVADNWQWKYFLAGTSILSPVLIPAKNFFNLFSGNEVDIGDSIESSCGSCGSCGGCGG